MTQALRKALLSVGLVISLAVAAEAQVAQLGQGFKQDPTLPVEVTSESLSINQSGGKATFTGNVLVVQGEMRLKADELVVEYTADGKDISRLLAKGNVIVTTPTEAAEAAEAIYTLKPAGLEMTGNVLVTQGTSTLAGDRLVYDMNTGAGRMEGRVKTVFQPETAQGAEPKTK